MQAGLLNASSWIAAKWLDRLAVNSYQGTESIELAEFGAFEANLPKQSSSTMALTSCFCNGEQRSVCFAVAIIAGTACPRCPSQAAANCVGSA